MPCVPVPTPPLPSLPAGFNFTAPLPAVPSITIAGVPCCILPTLTTPSIPNPLPPLAVNPAFVTAMRAALATAESFFDSLTPSCPRS
jgi:hypothetical protein